MAKMTPEQEAAYALDYGVARSDLSKDVQLAYDRLAEQRARERTPAPVSPATSEAAGGYITMPKWAAAVGTALSFPLGPGIVVVLVPWLITHWQPGTPPWPLAVRVIGVILIAAGGVVMVAAFARFPAEGTGLPFPTNPPSSRQVIVGGPYRYVRNPMYVAFFMANIGQALLLSRPVMLIYAAALLAALVAFVRLYEERTLSRRFGAQYDAYRKQVPGWWPRLPRQRP
jgi:protein-S-isoprenylcysteine O-methyltransferase Ste14